MPVLGVVSDCGLFELPSSIHSDDESHHDAFFMQTCLQQVDYSDRNAETSEKPLFSMRHEGTPDVNVHPRTRKTGYLDSKRRVVAGRLCYARPTCRCWLLKQGAMGDLPQLKEDLDHKITAWQREVDLKLMKSVWSAHVRTLEEDGLSEECVCELPRACLCCSRPPKTVERDIHAYKGMKDPAKDAEPVEDHLLASIHQGASNIHSNEDLEEKIKPLDPRV